MFPIRNIHQIELTSRCNLRCKYCLHPTMHEYRPKEDMSLETLDATLRWVRYFMRQGTQGSLNLAGIGESTIHERFIEFLAHIRHAVGDLPLVLATNGVAMTPLLAEQMKIATKGGQLQVFVSLHRPERAKLAIDALRDVGLLAGVSNDPALAATDWAGQIKGWRVTAAEGRRCPWITGGWAIVLADGRVTRCAFDGRATGVLGTVYEDVGRFSTKPYGLCMTCDQNPGVPVPVEAVA